MARGTGRKAARGSNLNRRKHRNKRNTPAVPNRSAQSILRDRVPKAGMIYPFERTLLRTLRSDAGISSAIRVGTHCPNLNSKPHLSEAADLAREDYDIGKFTDDPLALMESLRERPDIRSVWGRRSVDLLTSCFLVLRAACLNWNHNPRGKRNIFLHCRTALAVNSFLAVENLNWGRSRTVMEWLARGGLGIIRHDCAREQAAKDDNVEMRDVGVNAGEQDWMDVDDERAPADDEDAADSDSDAGFFVPRTCPVLPPAGDDEDDNRADTAGPRGAAATSPAAAAYEQALEAVMVGMARLNIEVDRDALAEAFARLRIEEDGGAGAGLGPAGRKQRRPGYPFVDELDEEDDGRVGGLGGGEKEGEGQGEEEEEEDVIT